jgi:hypothetical protein
LATLDYKSRIGFGQVWLDKLISATLHLFIGLTPFRRIDQIAFTSSFRTLMGTALYRATEVVTKPGCELAFEYHFKNLWQYTYFWERIGESLGLKEFRQYKHLLQAITIIHYGTFQV